MPEKDALPIGRCAECSEWIFGYHTLLVGPHALSFCCAGCFGAYTQREDIDVITVPPVVGSDG